MKSRRQLRCLRFHDLRHTRLTQCWSNSTDDGLSDYLRCSPPSGTVKDHDMIITPDICYQKKKIYHDLEDGWILQIRCSGTLHNFKSLLRTWHEIKETRHKRVFAVRFHLYGVQNWHNWSVLLKNKILPTLQREWLIIRRGTEWVLQRLWGSVSWFQSWMCECSFCGNLPDCTFYAFQ